MIYLLTSTFLLVITTIPFGDTSSVTDNKPDCFSYKTFQYDVGVLAGFQGDYSSLDLNSLACSWSQPEIDMLEQVRTEVSRLGDVENFGKYIYEIGKLALISEAGFFDGNHFYPQIAIGIAFFHFRVGSGTDLKAFRVFIDHFASYTRQILGWVGNSEYNNSFFRLYDALFLNDEFSLVCNRKCKIAFKEFRYFFVANEYAVGDTDWFEN